MRIPRIIYLIVGFIALSLDLSYNEVVSKSRVVSLSSKGVEQIEIYLICVTLMDLIAYGGAAPGIIGFLSAIGITVIGAIGFLNVLCLQTVPFLTL